MCGKESVTWSWDESSSCSSPWRWSSNKSADLPVPALRTWWSAAPGPGPPQTEIRKYFKCLTSPILSSLINPPNSSHRRLKYFVFQKKNQELLILETCERFPWLGGCTSQEDGGECRRIHSSSLSISRRPLTTLRNIVNTQFTLLRSASSSVVLVTRSNFSCKIRIPNVGTELMNWSAWYCIRVSTCKTMTSQNQTSDVITRDRIQVPLISSKQLSFIWRCIILKFSIFLLNSL